MSIVKVTVEVEAEPERVWAVIADPRNLPQWSRFIEGVEDVPDDGLALGVEYTVVLRAALRARVPAAVVEWDPPRHAVVRLSGLVDAIITTDVSELSRGRSKLKHLVDYRFRGGTLGEIGARSLRALGGAGFAIRHGVQAQKRQIEEQAAQ